MNNETGDSSLKTPGPYEPLVNQAEEAETTPDRYESDQTIGESFAQLLADARDYWAAEADRQKLRAGIVTKGVRDAAILATVAILLLFGTLVALLIGLIIALSPALTPLGATGAVAGAAILISVIFLLLAKARIIRMMKAAKE